MLHRSLQNFCLVVAFFLLTVAIISACSQEPQPDPTPTVKPATATQEPTATITATPTQTATPTLTPTPAPLTPAQIFETLSPIVAFIDTPTGSGSGVLIADAYLLTNAHVVWPFEEVRVVFADGEEFLDAPVINVDLMADLAIIGPLNTEKIGAPLVNGEDLVIGTDVFLLGYPGEVNDFPQPTITRGLISRLREWDSLGITYFQSDATIGGGQSGGMLVSELGDVIGISGFYFSEASFALVASASDILPRVEKLIAGEQNDQIGTWQLPLGKPGRNSDFVNLNGYWDQSVFLLNEPEKTEIEIELDGDQDGILSVIDLYGYSLIYADESFSGTEFGQESTQLNAPHFVIIEQDNFSTAFLRFDSNQTLIPYAEATDNHRLNLGDEVYAKIDFPGDRDVFKISLNEGQIINIQVDSVLIDPFVWIVPDRPFSDDELISDDDSGQGVFGLNAELTYKAPESGRYNILVTDRLNYGFGGYILTVGEMYEGAPTPIAIPPTATPIASEFGDLATFSDSRSGFTMSYPQAWDDSPSNSLFRSVCETVTICFALQDAGLLAILIEDLSEYGLGGITLDEYMDLIIEQQSNTATEVIVDETIVTESGINGRLIGISIQDRTLISLRITYLDDDIAYNATYIVAGELFEEIEPLLRYSLSTTEIP